MKILIATNAKRDKDFVVTNKVVSLLKNLSVDVINDDGEFSLYDTDLLSKIDDCDVVIVIGGDGTILFAAQHIYKSCKPIVAVNVGTLGYMSAIESSETDLLAEIVRKNYSVEKRMMLNIKIENHQGKMIFDENALNDVVFSHGSVSRILRFGILCDSHRVSEYRADGIVFATPTGSTAYSLSAGGPVVDPSLDTIIATPVCAHSFNSRSILFKSDSEIEIQIDEESLTDGNAYITVDGFKNTRLSSGYKVRISKSEYSVNLIRLKSDSFGDVLSRKIR